MKLGFYSKSICLCSVYVTARINILFPWSLEAYKTEMLSLPLSLGKWKISADKTLSNHRNLQRGSLALYLFIYLFIENKGYKINEFTDKHRNSLAGEINWWTVSSWTSNDVDQFKQSFQMVLSIYLHFITSAIFRRNSYLWSTYHLVNGSHLISNERS